MGSDWMGLLGILVGLGVLIAFAYRGWSVLLVGPAAALVAAAIAGEPLLASWTQTFMTGAAGFIAQFFPLFLLGALFGKLMDDSGSALAIAHGLTRALGTKHAILAVVIACALLTYGGISLFVVAFVIVPVAAALFQRAEIPHRLIPATVALGAFTFTMTAMPGTPAIQNAIPMPWFGTTPFAAPGLGMIAAAIMLLFGLWWLGLVAGQARRRGEGYQLQPAVRADPSKDDGMLAETKLAADTSLASTNRTDTAINPAGPTPEATALESRSAADLAADGLLRERASTTDVFDPAECEHGQRSAQEPAFVLAVLPILVVVATNLLMSLLVLPWLETDFLAEPAWGATSLAAVGGIWSVATALLAGILALIAVNLQRLKALRATLDAGANASVLPVLNTASMVGFGAVIAALPAFELISAAFLSLDGGPLVSLAVATNVIAGITGSASGGLMITLQALGDTYAELGAAAGIDPELMHRVASIASGGLSSLPHNGAVVTLLAIAGVSHKGSYRDIAVVMIGGTLVALITIIVLGLLFGSF
ncbi:MAG: GntP family permease [Lamprobacter sp.]|uniref:GntP family permease n=1 Tax=Lamprobacter sp. TaxID=3100796 RepID=UPI002B257A19|nr:GntP family permease [Lamprobacter sp.]MEA3643691.1 GntP family permease [Lamprobacter sp.]